MPQLKFQDRAFSSRDGESVLDAALRQGVELPFSCRSGICHVCMQRCVDGTVPTAAQHGLSPELVAEGYFLPCICVAESPLAFEPPSALFSTTMVHSKEMLAPDVCRLLLEPVDAISVIPGQFINVRRKDGVVRSYSLANVPEEDYFLELHVQRKQGGALSNWILDELQAGDEIDIQGPNGECHYRPDTADQSMLLVGTGTGVSPLIGIARDALRRGHRAEIHLYQGALSPDRLYLADYLRQLQQQYPHFHYHASVLRGDAVLPDTSVGDVLATAFAAHPRLSNWQVYLAGAPEMVERGEQRALECGAAAVHADAFALRELRATPREPGVEAVAAESDETINYPRPDPDLWAALDQGERLMAVLQDFYGRVFVDPRLSSFFEGVTRQRSIEKQYLFMRQLLTGEKIYFGDRPRNAHHWMVISDELFDYRGNLMMTCLREHGVAEEMVQRFHALEEYFRGDIVKAAPFPRKMGDVELPLGGFEELVLDVGSLCDTCQREVNAGEKVMYHLRLGKIYCTDCSEQHHHDV